ncbi:bifunctional folylpolyglutamate synthase/dihydrofolate synthase, partial [Candidatus Micrarchaeota archaeon]|nr:bifunctional folylpolyglutamate synthase/dihydrofolate synthase [Candidatus Micrarchaeota archaeon]
MNYNQSINYLESLPRPDSWHLDKTRKLFELTNTPTNALKIIHVAGTNGKGSVTTLIASILMQAGYRVGVD